MNDRIVHFCKEAGFHPHIISESAYLHFIEEMVANKLGISLLPESICSMLGNKVRSIRFEKPTIKWSLALIWCKNQYIPFAAKKWLEFTMEQLK